MSTVAKSNVASTIETIGGSVPVKLQGLVDTAVIEKIHNRTMQAKNAPDTPMRLFSFHNGIYVPKIWYTSKHALEKTANKLLLRYVDEVQADLGIGNYTFNIVGYEKGAILAPHTDEKSPDQPRPVTILQLAGFSKYIDIEDGNGGYDLSPGDVLVTDGNRWHSARNTGENTRTFLTFYS